MCPFGQKNFVHMDADYKNLASIHPIYLFLLLKNINAMFRSLEEEKGRDKGWKKSRGKERGGE